MADQLIRLPLSTFFRHDALTAPAVSGITLSGISASAIYSTIKVIQNTLLQQQFEKTKQQQQQYQQQHMSAIFATICLMSGVGLLLGFFLPKLNDIIGFFWLCFVFSLLLVTCVPLIAYFPKGTLFRKSGSQAEFSVNTSKKSIANNTRSESFAESILSDDETTLGSSSRPDCNVTLESKSIIVIP